MPDLPECLLVANRGEIARRLGVRTVAVYHPVDARLPFVAEADVAVALESDVPVKAYLDIPQLLRIARETGADAVHPGYGFLAENADFAREVETAGLTWV